MGTAERSVRGSCHCGFHTQTATHYFCRVCGIYPFHRKRVTPDFLGVNVHCLEDFDASGVPVRATIDAGMP
jgi:hypothetical protein